MSLLEQEGFVRTVPRRGIFVVRKTKAEIIEMIYIWAALESMSARLATQRASDEAIASLRPLFTGFESSRPNEHMDEYSEANVAFHQAIIRLGGCKMIDELTKNRSEEHTSELQSLMRNSYAVFCLQKKNKQ